MSDIKYTDELREQIKDLTLLLLYLNSLIEYKADTDKMLNPISYQFS